MHFEGRSVRAEGEGQIKQLLAACTVYVSMDITGEAVGEQMDTHLRNTVHSFSRTKGIEDVLDEQVRKEVDARCEIIREEYTKGETPIIEPQLEVPYTKKEMERAMIKLNKKVLEDHWFDGVKSRMIATKVLEVHWFGWCQKLRKAGDTFLNFLLEFYDKCWEQGEISSDWYETLVSYIYKNTGKLQELTSYRPIALTSILVHIFKTMWLQRLVLVVDKHFNHCQGGFRVGSGVKEQLWALL